MHTYVGARLSWLVGQALGRQGPTSRRDEKMARKSRAPKEKREPAHKTDGDGMELLTGGDGATAAVVVGEMFPCKYRKVSRLFWLTSASDFTPCRYSW